MNESPAPVNKHYNEQSEEQRYFETAIKINLQRMRPISSSRPAIKSIIKQVFLVSQKTSYNNHRHQEVLNHFDNSGIMAPLKTKFWQYIYIISEVCKNYQMPQRSISISLPLPLLSIQIMLTKKCCDSINTMIVSFNPFKAQLLVYYDVIKHGFQICTGLLSELILAV